MFGGVMSDYSIVNGRDGSPEVLGDFGEVRVLVTISHEKEYAVALVVVERLARTPGS